MKTAAVATSILAAATAVVGQQIQSKPFNVQLESDDKSLNGQYIGACHSGAAIESLCLTSRPVTMHLNSTNAGESSGLLTWLLPSNLPVDSAMRLVPDASSNVAQAIFEPGPNGGQYVGFDKSDRLVITSYIDDTKDPIVAGEPRDLHRWYVCDQYFTSYRYKTLSWVYGNAEPQNPTCVKVEAKRNFE